MPGKAAKVVIIGLLLAIPLSPLLGYPWGAVQAVLVLLILVRVFTAH